MEADAVEQPLTSQLTKVFVVQIPLWSEINNVPSPSPSNLSRHQEEARRGEEIKAAVYCEARGKAS